MASVEGPVRTSRGRAGPLTRGGVTAAGRGGRVISVTAATAAATAPPAGTVYRHRLEVPLSTGAVVAGWSRSVSIFQLQVPDYLVPPVGIFLQRLRDNASQLT